MKPITISLSSTLLLIVLITASSSSSPSPFTKAETLLNTLSKDIQIEQSAANIRNDSNTKGCNVYLTDIKRKIEVRALATQELKTQITLYQKDISDKTIDTQMKSKRIEENQSLLLKFRDQRCENNLLFIKQLRQYINSIDLLTLIKEDITTSFAVKPLMTESLSEIVSLITKDKKTKVNLLQTSLKVFNTHHINESIMSTAVNPSVDKSIIQNEVIGLIDDLIYHLKESRLSLERQEIKSAEDFAFFQINLEKENISITESIGVLAKEIEVIQAKLLIAKESIGKREELLQEALGEIEVIKKRCDGLSEYYLSETRRRKGELETLNTAKDVYKKIIVNLNKRAKAIENNNKKKHGHELKGGIGVTTYTHETLKLIKRVETRNKPEY